MYIIHQKYPAAKGGKELVDLLTVKASCTGGRSFKAFQYTCLVSFCLQPADKPGPDV